ncbi:hypothetical protein CHARACLAT_025845, partial [Characodon lateralis]|nr:hypothetical protein [Characodon lateralis]
MAKRCRPYKRYLEDYTAEIPRSTKYRWKIKNDNKDNQISVENCINTSNSEDEHEGLNAESTTTSKWNVDISENEEAMSYSEEDLSDAASNEDVMEGNRTREKTPEPPVGSEDQADGDNPL